MRDEGSHLRIWDRICSSNIQFVLRGKRDVQGAVGPIPLRERTTLNVDGISLCRIVDRVGAPLGDYLSDWLPWTGICLWTVSRHHLPRKMAIAGKDGLPFYAITPWVVLFAALGLVIHRVQEPSAYDYFLERLLCWAKVGPAKQIASPIRASSKRIFIVSSRGYKFDQLDRSFWRPC